MSRKWQSLNRRIITCQKCPRLIRHCQEVATIKRRAYLNETYWGKPVPNFGDPKARILVVGLAPGAHGANRTGRIFSGDRSGDWLYRGLFKAGLANQATSRSIDDGLELSGCAITNICHCAPPGNKPDKSEIASCMEWMEDLIAIVEPKVFLALGQMAWNLICDYAIRRQLFSRPRPKFSHAANTKMSNGQVLVGCYHPSQQNTFTGLLTEEMIDDVLKLCTKLAK